jgi:hypothetical protein
MAIAAVAFRFAAMLETEEPRFMRESDDHATLRMVWTALGLPAMRPVQIAETRDQQFRVAEPSSRRAGWLRALRCYGGTTSTR